MNRTQLSNNKILKDTLLMLLFGGLSYLLGFIYFFTPGIEGGSSNLIEIPLLISLFYLTNPLYLIGTTLIASLITPADGSYWSTFLMHIIPLVFSWYVVRFFLKKIGNRIILGAIWGLYVALIYYLTLVIPFFILTNHFFGLNLTANQADLYLEMIYQARFEIVTTSIVCALFIVLFRAIRELRSYQKELENKVEARTEELLAANLELKETIAVKDKFFRIIGHDLRAPIAQVIHFTELLEDGYKELPKETVLEFVQLLKSSSMSGLKLLENLLQWSLTQTDSIQFNPSTQPLTKVITDVFPLVEKNAHSKNILLQCAIDPTLSIYADKNMFQTILRNLISNAVKFTNEGGKIEIGAIDKMSEQLIYVKDNGVGMSQEDAKKLFSVNETQTTLGTQNEKGTGIGLLLCKEFMDLHQGRIWVACEKGMGCTFWLAFPKLVNN